MNFKFTKMHGLGNDFIVIDGIQQNISLSPEEIKAMGRRDTGIGFDQCLLVEKSNSPEVDFSYRIFNADGNEVGQCGNGARCLARFLHYYKLSDKDKIIVATATTRMILTINTDDSVTVNMGKPRLNPENIPLKAEKTQSLYTIPLKDGLTYPVHAINVGNPHAVIIVSDVKAAAVEKIGSALSNHCFFPEQTNVGFMEIKSLNHILLRVYERGSGETQACGSGAVAAAAVGRLFHDLHEKIYVELPGGELTIDWHDIKSDILLTGPAEFVYEGRLIA
jgi:diaminopimelate epimerase